MKKIISIKTIALFSIAYFSLVSVLATEPLSLMEYREMVVNYSNQIKMSREISIASENKFKATRTGYYPSLSASADANYITNLPQIPITGFELKNYSYSANLILQQNVYAGGLVRNKTEASKLELDISKMTENLTLESVLYAAEVIYWTLVASQQQLDISKEYVNIVNNLYNIVKERFDNGYISRTDLLMVQTRLNEANLQKIASERQYEQSLQNLNSMIGEYELIRFNVEDSISIPDELPLLENLDYALTYRPDYQIERLKLDLQNQLVKVVRSQYNPNLVVGLQGVWGTSKPNLGAKERLYGIAYATFRAPIFKWNERRYSVSSAKAGVNAQNYKVVQNRDDINKELENSITALSQNFRQVVLANSNMAIAGENLELNTYSYNEGRLPILDVLSAQLSWIQSFTSVVNSNYQYKVSYAEYRKAIGVMAQQDMIK